MVMVNGLPGKMAFEVLPWSLRSPTAHAGMQNEHACRSLQLACGDAFALRPSDSREEEKPGEWWRSTGRIGKLLGDVSDDLILLPCPEGPKACGFGWLTAPIVTR